MKNPYQPSSAALSLEPDKPKRPVALKVAIACVVVSFVLAVIDSDLFIDFELLSIKTTFYFVLLSITATTIYLSWAGYNWARFFCVLIYIAPDSYNRGSYAIGHIANSEMPNLFSSTILVFNLVSLFFLFKKENSRWISQLKSYRANGF